MNSNSYFEALMSILGENNELEEEHRNGGITEADYSERLDDLMRRIKNLKSENVAE